MFKPLDGVLDERDRERLWGRIAVSEPDECWEGTAGKFASGYGQIRVKGWPYRSHRLVYQDAFGDLPPDLCVLHRCDNRACNNPAHLFLGTDLDNVQDRNAKERTARGTRAGSARLTEADVRTIRERYERGGVRQIDLAKEYGVSQVNISHIILRKAWKHVA